MLITSAALLGLFFVIFNVLKREKYYYLHVILVLGASFLYEKYHGALFPFGHKAIVLTMINHVIMINLITLLAYFFDKKAAKNQSWRVPEASLHSFEVIGGTPAAFIAQRIWRHKTKKKTFRTSYWLIVFFQLLIIWFCFSDIKYFIFK